MQEIQRWLRILVIAITLIVIATGVLENLLPASIRSPLLSVPRSLIHITGFRQNWTMFSPDVTRDEIFFFAKLDYADGTSTILPFPYRGHTADWFPLHNVDTLRKWSSDFRQASPQELRDMAKFVVRNAPSSGAELNRVVLSATTTHLPELNEKWVSVKDLDREHESKVRAEFEVAELQDAK